MKTRFLSLPVFLACLTIALVTPVLRAGEIKPTAREMEMKSLWLKQHWLEYKVEPSLVKPQVSLPKASGPGLEVHANHDPVQLNSRAGKPLKLNQTEYTRGLYCHAFSKIVVRLPQPGKTFTALIGVDSNRDTKGGRGSVVFAVKVNNKVAFQSEVMRENTQARPVTVDLSGADSFILEIGEAGDGIACDQADWAEAKVTLANGKEIWLGEMPLLDNHAFLPSATPVRTTEVPFSFLYAGKTSDDLLGNWPRKIQTGKLDDLRTRHTLTWSDPQTGLETRWEVVEYADYPVVEWTGYFKNTGKENTPILHNIQALDTRYEATQPGDFVLHYLKGDSCSADSYEPLLAKLTPQTSKRFASRGGRPTNGAFPYYNLQVPGGGLMLAVGWPGQWASQFLRAEERNVRIVAGQELTHFYLEPGEEVRTPLIAFLFWDGNDVQRAHNLWRRWMLAHNVPRPGGKLPPVQLAACSSHQFGEMINANSDSQKFFIDRYLAESLKLDYWWMDAGWYWNKTGWPNTGTWEVDTKRFPGGLRPICDHAHAKGVNIIVWFEPERVTGGTWLATNHPEWILGGKGGGLLNLGNPEARNWLTNHVDKLLTEQGIDLYRQDFNMDPLGAWRNHDARDRQGITEIKHVCGYLAYWDELRRRHPDMLIDSCASGGRRNDLETLRRSVPLLRSDYIIEPVGNQGHTYGLAYWIPYYGTGSGAADPYMLRSVLCPHFTACFDMRRKEANYDLVRKILGQWRQFAPNYFGDYYPLTPYSLEKTSWIAWQFDRPDLAEGIVQAFRREKNEEPGKVLRLQGLDPAAKYEIKNLDVGTSVIRTGQELMDQGLPVEIKTRPGAAVISYKRKAD